MNGFELLRQINDIDDSIIEKAITGSRSKKKSIRKKYIMIAASITILVSIFGIANISSLIDGSQNGGGISRHDGFIQLLEIHREEFNSRIPTKVKEELEGENKILLKEYDMVNSNWFKSDDIEDFSQVVTPDYKYYVVDTKKLSIQVYQESNKGLEYLGQSTGDVNSCITQEQIEKDLKSIRYDDYIICNSSLLHSIFVWVRSSEQDYFLVYSERTDFTKLEAGKIYTLDDIIKKLGSFSD